MSEENTHSIYGASGASRWMTCSASPEAIELAKALGEIPQETNTSYSDEGTQAHDNAYKIATKQMNLEDVDVPEKDRIHLSNYLHETQACRYKLSSDMGGSHCYEKQVPLFYLPEESGTVDFQRLSPDPQDPNFGIDTIDLKWGVGVKVDAFENPQIAIYTFSSICEYEKNLGGTLPDYMPCRLGIYQPRHRSFTGDVDWWTLTLGELRTFCAEIEGAFLRAKNPDTQVFKPSDKACQFCDIKSICTERAKANFSGMPKAANPFEDFEEIGDTEPVTEDVWDRPEGENGTELTINSKKLFIRPEQTKWVVQHGKEMIKLIQDILAAETQRLESGGKIHGCKLVAGKQGNRTWSDEEQADKLLARYLPADERYQPKKLITAAQAKTKLKKFLQPKEEGMKKLSSQALVAFDFKDRGDSKTVPLIHRPEGNPVLVTVEDERPALTFQTTEQLLDEHEGGENPDACWE